MPSRIFDGPSNPASPGAWNPRDVELFKIFDRCKNRLAAIVDIIGKTHGVDPRQFQCLATDAWIDEKFLGHLILNFGWRMEATFEAGESQVDRTEFVLHPAKRRGGVGDVHEIRLAGQNHR